MPSAILRGSLEHGMLVCLGLLARKPMCFDAAAAAWHARWCGFLTGVRLADSHAALAALEAMAGPEPASGALALSRLCKGHGLDEVAAVLDGWVHDRSAPPAGGGTAEYPPTLIRLV